MNKINLFFLLLLISGPVSAAFEENYIAPKEPRTETNINKVTTEFQDNIDSYSDFEKEVAQMRETAASNAGGFEAQTLLGAKEAEAASQHLQGIGAHSLEARGRDERAKKENDYFDEFETDYTRPGALAHKKDAKEIADASDKVITQITASLRKEGIDCKEELKKPDLKDPFYIETEKQNAKEVEYVPSYCEFLRNRYSCTDELETRCADLNFVAGTIKDVEGNMVHSLDEQGHLFIGVDKRNYFWAPWGAQQDYEFTFSVDDPSGIETFSLLETAWSDWLLIKLNDKIIFQTPGVNGKLELSTEVKHRRQAPDGEWFQGVDIGQGGYVSSNTKGYYSAKPSFEAKQFLKKGKNTISLRLVYGNGGKLWAFFKYQERKCGRWKDEWSQVCKLD